jgi:hypothetical protein
MGRASLTRSRASERLALIELFTWGHP